MEETVCAIVCNYIEHISFFPSPFLYPLMISLVGEALSLPKALGK